jgi:2-amino-4-hydroxy-6-hydroxymethyldihydropteridine diphosphokinase
MGFMSFFLLGLGSNIKPEDNLTQAASALEQLGRVAATSPALATAPVGETFHHEFRNQLLILECDLPAPMLKHRLQAIEVDLGREPKSPARKTRDRPIDIDILAQAETLESCRHAVPEESYYQSVYQLWCQEENV